MVMEINNNMGNGAMKGFGMPMGKTGVDSFTKNIQSQIANKQREMQELSSNEDMTLEEKMKKRQEIQQEITTLNQQLRQHRIEQRKEQQAKKSSMDDMIGGRHQMQETGAKSGTGMSSTSMQAIISADSAMGQVKVQSSVKTEMRGKAAVLKSEIKMDKGLGASTGAKEAELAETEEKIDNIISSQRSALSDVNEKLEEAAKEESKTEKTDEKKDKADASKKDSDKNGEVEVSETDTHVDVRL